MNTEDQKTLLRGDLKNRKSLINITRKSTLIEIIRSTAELEYKLEIRLDNNKMRWTKFKMFPFNTNEYTIDTLKNKILIGKSVISAFMGISEKTLFNKVAKSGSDNKYSDTMMPPISKHGNRYCISTNEILFWKVQCEICNFNKTNPNAIETARSILINKYSDKMRINRKTFLKTYVYTDNEHTRFNTRPTKRKINDCNSVHTPSMYRKTLEKALLLLRLHSELHGNLYLEKSLSQ